MRCICWYKWSCRTNCCMLRLSGVCGATGEGGGASPPDAQVEDGSGLGRGGGGGAAQGLALRGRGRGAGTRPWCWFVGSAYWPLATVSGS